jgi:hypothetical protein
MQLIHKIKLARKNFPMTNALAYFADAQKIVCTVDATVHLHRQGEYKHHQEPNSQHLIIFANYERAN